MSGSAGLFDKLLFFLYLVGSPKVGGAGDGKHKKQYGHPHVRLMAVICAHGGAFCDRCTVHANKFHFR